MFLIIAWHPATGKTTLTTKVREIFRDHEVLHTDDYMHHGYKDSLYKLLENIIARLDNMEDDHIDLIVEWVMWARLMRKIQELKLDTAVDMYIYLRGTPRLIEETYERERPGKNFDTILSAIKGLDTVNASIDKTPNEFTVYLDLEIDKYDELDISKLNM